MLYWAAAFFLIALLAALIGLAGFSVLVAEITKIVFVLCLALFVVSLIASMMMRGPPEAG